MALTKTIQFLVNSKTICSIFTDRSKPRIYTYFLKTHRNLELVEFIFNYTSMISMIPIEAVLPNFSEL